MPPDLHLCPPSLSGVHRTTLPIPHPVWNKSGTRGRLAATEGKAAVAGSHLGTQGPEECLSGLIFPVFRPPADMAADFE